MFDPPMTGWELRLRNIDGLREAVRIVADQLTRLALRQTGRGMAIATGLPLAS